jgi:hypothetical protein
MSKDILAALLILLVSLIVWDVAATIHQNRSGTLPPDLAKYLQEVSPTLDTSTLELLSLDQASQGR